MTRGIFDLSGKVAVVTGGNGGLGLAYARGLARHGASIAIWGRDEAKNARASEELRGLGAEVLAQRVAVDTEAEIVAGFAETMRHFGRIDTVVANAGVSKRQPSLELSSEDWHALLAVNLHGAFFTLREGARHMVARAEAGQPGGSLIVCGSGASLAGVPGLAHYAAAKTGLTGVVRVLAAELGKYGIRANVIAPGLIKTDLLQTESFLQMVTEKTPLGRPGEPQDLEGVAVYLASDASRFHSGDILNIDGGWMASYF
jgi:NAD(P)-dependent dehydrogenase (short-subunit alcohol dehydrogenase family)